MALKNQTKPDNPTKKEQIKLPTKNPRRSLREEKSSFNEKISKIKQHIETEVNTSALTQGEKDQINKSVDSQISNIKLNLEKKLKAIGENIESEKGREIAEQFLNKLRKKYKTQLETAGKSNSQKESTSNFKRKEALYGSMTTGKYTKSIDKVMKKYEVDIKKNAPEFLKRLGLTKEEINDLKGVNSKAILEALMRREIQFRNEPNIAEDNTWLSKRLADAKNFSARKSEDIQDSIAYGGYDNSIGDFQTRPSAYALALLRKSGFKNISPDTKPEEIIKKFHKYMEANPDKDFAELKNLKLKERKSARFNILVNNIRGKGGNGSEGALNAMIDSMGNKPPEKKGDQIYIYPDGKRTKIYLKPNNGDKYRITAKNPKTRAKYLVTLNKAQIKLAILIAGYQGHGLSFASKDPKAKEGDIIEANENMIISPRVLALIIPDQINRENNFASDGANKLSKIGQV